MSNQTNIGKSPNVSFSSLAKLMGATTPAKRLSLLRGHKYPKGGGQRAYQHALSQAVSHVVSQTPFNPSVPNLDQHEIDVITDMQQGGIALPRGASAVRPPVGKAQRWAFAGVDISFYPDVLLHAANGDTGAAKFVLSKDALPRGVGASMAALLHHYRRVVMNDQSCQPHLCVVYEPRTSNVYTANGSPRLLAAVQVACAQVLALWPLVQP